MVKRPITFNRLPIGLYFEGAFGRLFFRVLMGLKFATELIAYFYELVQNQVMFKYSVWPLLPVLNVLALVPSGAAEVPSMTAGQLLYVPVYSEVPFGNKGLNLTLTATLSVRNTDLKRAIVIKRVDYYADSGELVRAYLKQPQTIKPLASVDFIVKESDRSGGISATFLVEWEGSSGVSKPYVEAIMINSTYNQGIAFNSPARVLEERQ